MTEKKQTADDHRIYLRRAKALELRVKGKMTMREIAQATGVSVCTAHKDIHWMIDHETGDLDSHIRAERKVENQRLDEWLKKTLSSLETAREVDDQVKLLQTALKISERRAKLLGLDAPIKTEVEAVVSNEATPAAARSLMEHFFGKVTPPGGSDSDGPAN